MHSLEKPPFTKPTFLGNKKFHVSPILFSVLVALSEIANAQIEERPVAGKIYNEFLYWDNQGSKDFSIEQSSGNHIFTFNEGAYLDASNGGNTSVFHPFSNYIVNTTINVGKDKTLTILSDAHGVIHLSNSDDSENHIYPKNYQIIGGNLLFYSGDRSDQLDNGDSTLHVEDKSELYINSNKLQIVHNDSIGQNYIGALSVTGTASILDIKLSDQFRAEGVLFGLAIQEQEGATTKGYIHSDNGIFIKASNNNAAAHGYYGAGLYALGLYNEESLVDIDLSTDDGEIRIETQGYGIYSFGQVDIDLISNTGNIYVLADEKQAIYSSRDETLELSNDILLQTEANINLQSIRSYAVRTKYDSMVTLKGKEISLLSVDNSVIRTEGNSTFKATGNKISVTSLANDDAAKTALYAVGNSSQWLKASDIVIDSYYGICIWDQAQVNVDATNELFLNADREVDGLTVLANGNAAVNINKNVDKPSRVLMHGELRSINDGEINVQFGKHSSFTGFTSSEAYSDNTAGTINLNFDKKSTWTLIESSTLTSLEMNDSLLDFSSWQGNQDVISTRAERSYHSLTTQNFSGNDNNFLMHIDLANESETNVLTDQLIITGSATGTNTATIAFDGSDVVNKTHSTNWLISQGAGSNMTVTAPDGGNQYAPNGGIFWWALKFVPESQNAGDLTSDEWNALNNKGEGAGKWYLVQTDEPSQGGNTGHAPLPPEAEQIQNLGSSVAQAVGWLSEKNDLRRRLGEVRYGSQAGAWAKAFTRQDRAEGFRYNGFKQESTGIHIGYDTFASQNEHTAWLVGATFRYAHSKQEGIETAYGGDGKLNEYSGKVYATWMHESGSYMDILAQVGYYDQEINGLNNVGNGSFDADYHNWGYGASVEVGHMFTVSNGSDDRPWYNHWFIEPQLELSYFYVKGEDFKTSTGLKVEQGDADFLTGRAGLVVGKKVNYGTLNDLDKRWYQIGVIGGVTHEFLGDQTITFTGTEGKSAEVKGHGLGGTSFYYGVTADWQVSDNVRLYGEVSREEGEHYTKDYGVNVGFKYSF